MIQEKADTKVDVMETKLFTNIAEKIVGNAAPSKIIPLLAIIGSEWGLKPNRVKHFKIAKRILINSIKNN